MKPDSVMGWVWFAWFVSWWAAAAWSNPTVERPAARREVPYRAVVIAGILLLFGVVPHSISTQIVLWQSGTIFGWAMILLALLGFLFAWWARIFLGRLWSATVTRKENHRVVDTGPYALVRHPIYTGIILASFATAALRGTALAFLGAAVMTVSWYIKARLEENFLREKLGSGDYDAYAQRVPMLVPFLGCRRGPIT